MLVILVDIRLDRLVQQVEFQKVFLTFFYDKYHKVQLTLPYQAFRFLPGQHIYIYLF